MGAGFLPRVLELKCLGTAVRGGGGGGLSSGRFFASSGLLPCLMKMSLFVCTCNNVVKWVKIWKYECSYLPSQYIAPISGLLPRWSLDWGLLVWAGPLPLALDRVAVTVFRQRQRHLFSGSGLSIGAAKTDSIISWLISMVEILSVC